MFTAMKYVKKREYALAMAIIEVGGVSVPSRIYERLLDLSINKIYNDLGLGDAPATAKTTTPGDSKATPPGGSDASGDPSDTGSTGADSSPNQTAADDAAGRSGDDDEGDDTVSTTSPAVDDEDGEEGNTPPPADNTPIGKARAAIEKYMADPRRGSTRKINAFLADIAKLLPEFEGDNFRIELGKLDKELRDATKILGDSGFQTAQREIEDWRKSVLADKMADEDDNPTTNSETPPEETPPSEETPPEETPPSEETPPDEVGEEQTLSQDDVESIAQDIEDEIGFTNRRLDGKKVLAALSKIKNQEDWNAVTKWYKQTNAGDDLEEILSKSRGRKFDFDRDVRTPLEAAEVNMDWYESTDESISEARMGMFEETYDDDDEFYEMYGELGIPEDEIWEADYRGRKVKLNKPMRGDVKKFKVYVKNNNGNVIKVNFGDPNSKIKKSNPARRRSFRARHNCDNPGPKTKARYWSCRKW